MIINSIVDEGLLHLLKQADPKLQPNPHVIDCMIKQFFSKAIEALNRNDKKLVMDVYESTLSLPQTETEINLNIQGYYLDGGLLVSNESLLICFKRTKPCLLKVLNEVEAARMRTILPK